MSYFYNLYGLVALSDLPIPELTPVSSHILPVPELTPVSSHILPDIFIRLGAVPEQGLPDCKRPGPFSYAAVGKLWLFVPGVARYLITDGSEITIEPCPGIDEDSVRVFLLGTCIGALLQQRGFLLLHGNAIAVGDKCLVCVGASGIGKSTLAAAFMQRGHKILADDVVAVDGDCHAIPGFPRIKLWQDAAEKLDIATAGLHRIRPDLEKFNLPLADAFHDKAALVEWIYVIKTHADAGFLLTEIHGLERLLYLKQNTYRPKIMQGMAIEAQHFKQCSRLAGNIRLVEILRPKREFCLDELAGLIHDDVAAHA